MCRELFERVASKPRLAMLTAYDFPTARLCEEAGLDMILVGDSLAMVVQGKEDTRGATMEQMLYHTEAVARGASKTLIVGDMPNHSYDTPGTALANARRFCEAGAHAVKVEGCCAPVVQALVAAGIPVMGHIGLQPQTAKAFRVQGREPEAAARLRAEASCLDRLGVFALVLECMPAVLGRSITGLTRCRTIGIGAGPHCDGQVLVIYDMLGLYDRLRPRFTRRYAELWPLIADALRRYREDVEKGLFPDAKESYT